MDDLALVDERLAGKGVRLRKLIDIAGPGHGCEYLTLESADGEFAATSYSHPEVPFLTLLLLNFLGSNN